MPIRPNPASPPVATDLPGSNGSFSGPLVVVLAYDGLCMFEFGVAVEVFGLSRPEMGPDWYRFAIASVDPGDLRTTAGLRLQVDGGLDLLTNADIIIVPGWKSASSPVPAELIDRLRQAHARGARLLSICSGVFVLAATGLLSGREATTHWRYTDQLSDMYPDLKVVPDVLYVDTGQILTSAGSAAGIDLCLHLVRREKGAQAANMVARRLVVPPHREGGQAQFVPETVPRPTESARLSPLFDALRKELDQPHQIAGLARRVGMSERTFLRRFQAASGMTPARWLLLERLKKVRELLETSAEPMEAIAFACGFGTATNLRHHFRKELQTTPSAYRAQFSQRLPHLPE